MMRLNQRWNTRWRGAANGVPIGAMTVDALVHAIHPGAVLQPRTCNTPGAIVAARIHLQ
jgi:hypothetical protein